MEEKKKELFDRWMYFDCECGHDDAETERARKAYFDYCIEIGDVIEL